MYMMMMTYMGMFTNESFITGLLVSDMVCKVYE